MTSLGITLVTLALIVPRVAAPESMGSFDGAALAEPATVSLQTEEGRRRLESVAAVLEQELSWADRTRLGSKVLSARRLTIARGRFASSAEVIVIVNVELKARDPELPPQTISGAFTLDAQGALGTVLVPPAMRAERIELVAVGDVDADGLDDVLLTHRGQDQEAMHLVSWNAGVAVDHVVKTLAATGDDPMPSPAP